MRTGHNGSVSRAATIAALLCAAGLIAGCASQAPKSMVSKPRSKEYFAESEYGVKASPRVSTKRSRLPRGGGREQVGKAYKVKGKWYYPKEQPGYSKVGAASWYGDAFHGRLTANGEIYDMTHLTAAHPTMPLPSYARVTNTTNGHSVIVRVNDRGPFAHNRIIDLSKRAAEMLDYTHSGVAKVKVDYVGRAPLHGQDDQYLMASYRPGRGGPPDPVSDGLPEGVMVAMAGPSPSAQPLVVAAFPGQLVTTASVPQAPAAAFPVSADPAGLPLDLILPAAGPIVPERPSVDLRIASVATTAPRLLSYADRRVARAAEALEAFSSAALSPAEITAAHERRSTRAESEIPPLQGPHIAAGSFSARADAERVAAVLSGFGSATIVADGDAVSVVLVADGRHGFDEMLRLAWENGAPEAIPVR